MRRLGSSTLPAPRVPVALRRLGALRGAALVAVAAALTGCGAPCEQLRDWVCDGRGEDYCVQVDGFLAKQQVDGDGKALEGEAREESCRYIMSNVELKHAYRFKAKERLLGEPYFEVRKNRKASESDDADAGEKKKPVVSRSTK
ncbi:MAG: hypothetical protein R3B09_07305 [Nannocystaceae bacterium]